MTKGKTKKNKRYVSLILAPHYPGQTKIYKLPAGLFKYMRVALLVIITALICQGLWTFHLIQRVNMLSRQRDKLAKTAQTQLLELNDAIQKYNLLQSNNEQVQEIMKDYTEKYREITENYIASQLTVSRADSVVNRTSGNFTDDIRELRDILAKLGELSNIDSTTTVDFSKLQDDIAMFLGALPTLWPAQGRISDNFGYRTHPISFLYKLHSGIDIAADYGADIVAAADGTVIMSGTNGGYGKCIIIDHGNGLKTLYAHASELLVSNGAKVKKGELIARVGSTGTSTGPHLHFEVQMDDVPIDPLIYLDQE
ncbi:MAG TPA: M23 family metallopeptidase [Clostridiaceae bacterium]|nr:M23 family metallopeptidase [Clostridiaceae bacterium]